MPISISPAVSAWRKWIIVDDDQITSCGKLNFDADTNARPVDDQTLSPINPPGRFPSPSFSLTKPRIDHAPYCGSAIRILLFVNV